MKGGVCAEAPTAPDEQQAPEPELDALLLAGSTREPCVSGVNRG